MRKYVTRTITKKITEQVEKTCDICGYKVEGVLGYGDNWDMDQTNHAEVILQMSTGTSYAESVSGKRINVDVCPKCFMDKVLPYLKSLGAVVYEEPWEY